jgi:hypothetical protein
MVTGLTINDAINNILCSVWLAPHLKAEKMHVPLVTVLISHWNWEVHHVNHNMSMRLENGKLASNAKENMSVFGMHFDKVMNNHRPVDRSVLNLLEQKPCMMVMVIDNPIVLLKSNEPSTSWRKGKHQASMGSPPKHSKKWTTSHDEQSTVTYATSSRVKLIMKGGIKASVSQCLSKVI